MTWRGSLVVDVPNEREAAQRAAVAAERAIRSDWRRIGAQALSAWRRAIPVDTGQMIRLAESIPALRVYQSRGGEWPRGASVVSLTIAFRHATRRESIAWYSLVARSRPDLRDWPVKWMDGQNLAPLLRKARRAADPILEADVNRAVIASWRGIIRRTTGNTLRPGR